MLVCSVNNNHIIQALNYLFTRDVTASSIVCGFHVQNPLDLDADLSQIKITSYYGYCNSTYLLKIKQLQTN